MLDFYWKNNSLKLEIRSGERSFLGICIVLDLRSMNREILRLAIPNILSNLSVPLLGLVDTALMGHLPEAGLYLGAVGIATAIFNVLYWSFAFLRMGTTGLTAQSFGADNKGEALLVLGRGLSVAMVGGILLIALQIPIELGGMYIMEGSAAAKDIARDYFYIRIFAAPATLGMYVWMGWFLGMQNAVVPLVLSIAINVVNIVANFFFVYQLEMEAEGIAWGTVLAQYSGFLLGGLFFLLRYRDILPLFQRRKLLAAQELKRFLLVNRDIFIRTACLVFVFTFFTSRSGSFGDEVLAANMLLIQLLHLMSYITDGFALAAESLVGKYLGENTAGKMAGLVRRILAWGLGFGAVFSLVYWIFGPGILGLLSDDQEIVDLAMEYLPWMILMPIWGTFAFMWDGIFIGATASVAMRNTMILATIACFVPAWLLSQNPLENHGLWLAMTAFMLARGIFLAVSAPKNKLGWRG